jgi:hypothetical protein
LAILTACHPWIPVGVKPECANEIPHLHRFEEFAVAAVDDNSILLAVTDPDIAICWIYREPMNGIELSGADTVTVPLVDELARLIKMDDSRYAKIIGCIV